MILNCEYKMDALPLANASFVFTEKKPLLMFAMGAFNIFAVFLFGIMFIKLVMMGLNPNEWIILLLFGAWLFLRKPIAKKVYLRRVKKSNLVDKTIHIEISRNGIVWSGEGLKTNHIAWKHIQYALELKNGYIIPFSMVRFIWIPNAGFKSKLQIDKFKNLIIDKQVPIRSYTKISC